MPNALYLTAPVPSTANPISGIPYIIGNEAAERFSFYGMRAILVDFMTKFLLDSQGDPAHLSEDNAKYYYHLFVASAYFFPVFGAILADVWLGKYRTIVSLSLVYCLGHLALAIDDTKVGLFTGLALIAVGSGGIKPCVSARVGDQFGKSNVHGAGADFRLVLSVDQPGGVPLDNRHAAPARKISGMAGHGAPCYVPRDARPHS